jgi:hypothetical protein
LLLGAEGQDSKLSRKGEWLPINPPPDSLVCNVGDMLQRLTNLRLRSTTHRVTNPPNERASNARYSLPFFLHFNPDFLIKTLPQCIDEQHPDQFPEPISAHDFLHERLREINSSAPANNNKKVSTMSGSRPVRNPGSSRSRCPSAATGGASTGSWWVSRLRCSSSSARCCSRCRAS